MKKLVILILITGCKKMKDPISDGAKLTKADAGKLSGIWWSEKVKDSLVISFDFVKDDSVHYRSNMIKFDSQLTHHLNYEPTDENLKLKDESGEYSFRIQH
jgi:hypothetical protein